MNHIRYMQYALDLAERAKENNEVPVGAIVVLNNEIIGKGFNSPINLNDPTGHAEIIAIRDAAKHMANYRLPGTTLYVTLEPCSMCLGAIIHSRIECLVFGAFEPRAGAVVSGFNLLDEKQYNHNVKVVQGILQEPCSEIISTFFKQKRGLKSNNSV